jgi:hypothetical protein
VIQRSGIWQQIDADQGREAGDRDAAGSCAGEFGSAKI